MKKRKLLFLLVLMLCASILFTSCAPGTEDKDKDLSNDGTGTPAGENGDTSATSPEILSWFVLDPTEHYSYHESVVYLSAKELEEGDGKEVVSSVGPCRVVKTTTTNAHDNVYVRVQVFSSENNLQTIIDCQTYYPNGEEPLDITVSIIGNLIKLRYKSDYKAETAKDYVFLVSENGKSAQTLCSGTEELEAWGATGSGYYLEIDGTMYWYSESGNLVYSVKSDIYESYDLEATYSRDGYLYWVGSSKMHVYANNTCVYEYVVSPEAWDFDAFFINDGSLVIQERYVVDDTAEEYDDLYMGTKYNVVTKTLDITTGESTELDVDFTILELEGADDYTGEFPFDLVAGKENQAYIRPFNKAGSFDRELVVLNNKLEVEYTFVNKAPNLAWDSLKYAVVVAEDRYAAYVVIGDETQYQLFDLDGNPISALTSVWFFPEYDDNYIVTLNAVYDKDMKLVYDFAENGVELHWTENYFIGDEIVVTKDANGDGYVEYFKLNPATKKLTLLADNVKTTLCDYRDSYYIIKTYCEECINHVKTCACFECEIHATHVRSCTDEIISCEDCQAALSHYETCEKFAAKGNSDYDLEDMYYIIDHLQTCTRGDNANLNYIGAIGRHRAQLKHVASYATDCDRCINSCNFCDNCVHTFYNVNGKFLVRSRGCMEVSGNTVTIQFEGKEVYFELAIN